MASKGVSLIRPRRKVHGAGGAARLITRRGAFTLVELLIVVVLMAIGAAAVMTMFEPSAHSQLTAGAEVVASDLAYARSLAVSNNSEYQLRFDSERSSYALEHVGQSEVLDQLPSSPFSAAEDSGARQTTRLGDLPHVGPSVKLLSVLALGGAEDTPIDSLRFTALGGTHQAEPTRIWLISFAGSDRLAIPIDVNPVTGLATIGDIQPEPATSPATLPADPILDVDSGTGTGGLTP